MDERKFQKNSSRQELHSTAGNCQADDRQESCSSAGNCQADSLESPRDEGAWWAAIYGVAQSRTRLK